MAPRSFMFVAERFVSHCPTPSGWPKGGTLLSAGGPCLSEASWSALLRLASLRSHEARRGVNGFGAFCRIKRLSPAEAKPGNTEHQFATRVGDTGANHLPTSAFLQGAPKIDFRHTSSSCKTRIINFHVPLFRSAAIRRSATAPPDAGFCPVITLMFLRANGAHGLSAFL